jgi:sialidase-1
MAGRRLRRVSGALVAASIACAGLMLALPAQAQAASCSSTPFKADPKHRTWFRVPAIVKTRSGALLAFAEGRDRELGDMGNFDIVYTRSTNGGCSWSKYRVIGNDGRNRVSNPVPVVDQSTGDILLFSVIAQYKGPAHQGLYLQTSTNDGLSFSPVLANRIRPLGAYKGGLTGPGHAIQLSVTHRGRIIVPLGYKTSKGLYGAYGIYSDDHGKTWRTGFDQQDTSGKYDLMEGTIAELPTGKLFISFRLKHDLAKAGTARQYAISSDGGESLDGHFRALPLKIVSVQGSALGLKGSHQSQLLFSAPSDRARNLRRDMSIFVSTTGGRSWSKGYHVRLESTPASYSDLVQLSDTSVGVIYETGKKKWKERIAFERAAIPRLTSSSLASSRISYHKASSVPSSSRATVRVRVKVAGITHTPGRITLRYAGAGRSGQVSARFTYSTKGRKTLTLPKLRPGKYRLKLVYSGYNRIKATATGAGVLRVH